MRPKNVKIGLMGAEFLIVFESPGKMPYIHDYRTEECDEFTSGSRGSSSRPHNV